MHVCIPAAPSSSPELAVELQQQLLHVSNAACCTDERHQLALRDASQLTTAAAAASRWQGAT
jgi:hypothetical protein